MEYTNPVLPGFNPDPSVCRAGEDYFLATSSFEYFPGVPLYHSRNLVDWEPIGYALTRDSQLPLEGARASGGIFAPTLRHHDGTFYLITTNVSADGHFVVTADDPRGRWSDPTWIDGGGIDPDVFWDDGDCYFTWRAGEEGIVQATVDLETGELGERRELANRLEGDYTEAPHVYEVDGTYYLVVAEGGTHVNHMVSVARADDPTGPYEGNADNPVLSHRNVSGAFNPIQATGHGDLVRAHDGSWWIVFLGIRTHGGHPGWHNLGRETFLAPVSWEDGWPIVDGGEFVEAETSVADTDLERADAPHRWETTDPFAGEALGPEWNYRRNPERERYALVEGGLELQPGPETLTEQGATFVGRRQQHHACRATARLDLDPADGTEAGLTVFANEDHHYALGVDGGTDGPASGDKRAFLRLQVGPATEEVARTALPRGPVELAIEADTGAYRFHATGADGEERALGTAPTRYVSTEVTGGFTGVYVGCYATNDGEPAGETARFESFAYESRT